SSHPRSDVVVGSPPRRRHDRDDFAAHQKNCLHIYRHHPVPVRFAQFDHRSATDNAGIVEQDVECAKLSDGALEDAPAVLYASDIAGFEDGVPALMRDFGSNVLAVSFIYVHHYNRRAFAGKQKSRGPPDAGSSAGNQGTLALELHRLPSPPAVSAPSMVYTC